MVGFLTWLPASCDLLSSADNSRKYQWSSELDSGEEDRIGHEYMPARQNPTELAIELLEVLIWSTSVTLAESVPRSRLSIAP